MAAVVFPPVWPSGETVRRTAAWYYNRKAHAAKDDPVALLPLTLRQPHNDATAVTKRIA